MGRSTWKEYTGRTTREGVHGKSTWKEYMEGLEGVFGKDTNIFVSVDRHHGPVALRVVGMGIKEYGSAEVARTKWY